MMKLRSKKFCRSSSKLIGGGHGSNGNNNNMKRGEKAGTEGIGQIKWELRPGGMLVQMRDMSTGAESVGEGMITVRVSTISKWHDISIEATSTFGELKMILSLVTALEPREERLLFKGKERDDGEYLHMVGVRDKDKVLLLEDPVTKERKLTFGFSGGQAVGAPCSTCTISV